MPLDEKTLVAGLYEPCNKRLFQALNADFKHDLIEALKLTIETLGRAPRATNLDDLFATAYQRLFKRDPVLHMPERKTR